MSRVLVVGGGITGLAAAHRLRERLGEDVRITVAERADRLGGKIRTVDFAGTRVEAGAESLLAARPEAVALARAVGLGERLRAPSDLKPALCLDGGLVDLPQGTVMGLPADPSEVDAVAAVKAPPAARGPILAAGQDISVGELVRAHLGDDVADRLVAPLLGGVYAGDIDRLSLRMAMPGLAAALERHDRLGDAVAAVRRPPSGAPVFMSVDGGLSELVDATAAAARADIRLGTTVRELRRTATGWEAVTGPVPAPAVIEADAVVIAVPGTPTAKLLAAVAPDAAAILADLDYASVALAVFAFDHADLPRRSGLLIPAEKGRAVKAATFFTAKWPHLKSGHTLVRASMGRSGEAALLQRPDDELARLALAELGERLGEPLPEPVAWRVDRWGGSLPQYAPGHGERVAAVRAALADYRGLAVAGAALDGVGIAACVASGRAAADRICEHLGTEGP